MRNLLFINTIVLLLLQITARIAIDSNNNNNNNNNKVFSAELSIVSNSNATAEYDYRQDMNYIASRYGGDILGVSNANILNVAEKKILMHIGIGANNKQMKVMLDTGSCTLWVFTTECVDKEPTCQGHDKVDMMKEKIATVKRNGYEQVYGALTAKGDLVHGSVFLTKDLEVKDQLFGGVNKLERKPLKLFDGILGLAVGNNFPNPFMNAISQENLHLAPVFSIYLKQGEGSIGEITFGGSNEARYKKDTKLTVSLLSHVLYHVQMTSVKIGDTELCTYDKKVKTSCEGFLDVGAPFIVGPHQIVNTWAQQTFKTLDTKKYPYRLDCAELAKSPPLIITFGNKALTLEPSYFSLASRGNKDKCYLHLVGQNMGQGNLYWIIGVPLNFKYYTEFNVKSGEESVTFYEAV